MKLLFAFSTQVACLFAEEAPASLRGASAAVTEFPAENKENIPAPPTADPPRRLAVLGNGVTTNEVGHSFDHIKFVTCPFLGALLHDKSGAADAPLLNKDVCSSRNSAGEWDGRCSKEELEDITNRAGMDPLRVSAHIEGNFANYPQLLSIGFGPSQLIDIFNMEGAVNEHVTSTGLNDCETVYWNCHTEGGVKACNSQLVIPGKDGDKDGARFSRNIKDCKLHKDKERETYFDGLWEEFLGAMTVPRTKNGKKWITHRSLEHAQEKDSFPVNDFNGIGGGTIAGAFGFLIDACVSCSHDVSLKDPWTGSPYAIESKALYKWNKDRVFPSGFDLNSKKGNDREVRVQWHLGPNIDKRDEDGVSCDDVCASLAFDGNPQVCVDEWREFSNGKGSLVGQPKNAKGMALVGRQAGFFCTATRSSSVYGPIAVLRNNDKAYSNAACLAVHPSFVRRVNCKTRQPKNHFGRKVCPCKPVNPTGYGNAKNTAGKRRKDAVQQPVPQIPQMGIR